MITYQVDMEDLTRIEAELGMVKDKTKAVMRTAINDTAKQTMQLLIVKAAQKYSIKDRQAVKKTLTLEKAKMSNLTATITSQGRVNELYNFRVNPNIYVRGGGIPGGYKGKVLRSNRGKKLVLKPGEDGDEYKAFIVRYKNGHMTVGQRVPGKRMKSNPKKEFVKSLLSPSVPKMLGGESGVYREINADVHKMLFNNIQKQILRYLK